ncbi:hypothetical protein CIW49_01955 [Mycolicibacterium sp. P1-18]|uniref:DUF202 domain-containing protein n=1 Tax=Mycolicibacterium sp. P1-18 TaxID=2024615 RepID=UPI0011F1234D|nr:DUF202 domain-containing protein [Mycolicibacterium sp. P1-18]KAA0102120.1 hypothetical protein CIW49_01955 [Mycolicibacterium sp. P1-18]
MSGALQRERTQLGWERTAFSFMAVGILVGFRTREALVPGHSLLAAVALLAAAAALVRRRRLSDHGAVVTPARRTVALTGAVTAALGVACAVAVWW